jgi:glycosyltransferase involved in cell wall biosynthesis
MRVAISFDGARLGTWSWRTFEDGLMALSGTDAAVLDLAVALGMRGVDIVLLSRCRIEGFPSRVEAIDSLETAVPRARELCADLLVLVNTHDEAMTRCLASMPVDGVPCVVWDQNGPGSGHARQLAACSVVRRVVTVSSSQADWVRDHPVFGKVEVIPNFLPTAFSRYLRQQPELLPDSVAFVGALTETKGFQHLAAAWQAVRARVPAASLHVFGSSGLYDRSQRPGELGVADADFERRWISRLGTSQRALRAGGVHFHGLVGKRTLAECLPRMTVGVVNPNVTGSVETFSVSALEFQASGVPVVGAMAGGLRETVVHGSTGFLLRSPRLLPEAILSLLRDPLTRSRMGAEARSRAFERFTLERALERWLRLFAAVLNAEPAPPLPFDTRLLTSRSLVREILRRIRRVPGLSWIPPLSEMGALIRGRK